VSALGLTATFTGKRGERVGLERREKQNQVVKFRIFVKLNKRIPGETEMRHWFEG